MSHPELQETQEDPLLLPSQNCSPRRMPTSSEGVASRPQAVKEENTDAILYGCKLCEKVFESVAELEPHFMTHCSFVKLQRVSIEKKSDPRYTCDLCDQHFACQVDLSDHALLHSVPTVNAVHELSAEHCESSATERPLGHDEEILQGASVGLPLSQGQITHSTKSTSNVGREWEYKCIHNTLSKEPLTSLRSGKRNTVCKSYVCDVGTCMKRFTSSKDFKKHRRICNHYDSKGWACCGHCNYRSVRQHSLRWHMQRHLNEGLSAGRFTPSVVPCQTCGKKFMSQVLLKSHALTHKDKKSVTVACDIAGPVSPPVFPCKTCGMKFISQGMLKGHALTHKDNKSVTVACDIAGPVSPPVFPCKTCGMKFISQSMLKGHALTHKDKKSVTVACDITGPVSPPVFPCKTCGMKFISRSLLKSHALTHKDKKSLTNACHIAGPISRPVFTCTTCGLKFVSQSMLNDHDNKSHNVNKSLIFACDVAGPISPPVFPCKTCGQKFISQKMLNDHALTHNVEKSLTFACDVATCNDIFKCKRDLDSHKLVHAVVENYACNHCDYRGRNQSQLDCHMLHHTNVETSLFIPPVLPCKTCGMKFVSESMLEVHALSHTDDDSLTFACDVATCDESFKCKRDLDSHKVVHSKPFACDRCSYRCRDLPSLSLHTQLHCNKCGKRYMNERLLKKHMLYHDGESSNLFVCSVAKCEKIFKSMESARKHKATHTNIKRFSCDKCDYSARLHSTLRCHMQVHISSDSSNQMEAHLCVRCGKRFVYKYLLAHHELTHVDDDSSATYVCDKTACGKRFKHKAYLQNHIRRVHSVRKRVKRLACDKCEYRCERPLSLRYHVLKHLQHDPVALSERLIFQCNICEKKFIDKSRLNYHLMSHEDKRSFICDVASCGMRFNQKSTLRHHIQAVHFNVKQFPCHKCDKRYYLKGNLKRHLLSHLKRDPLSNTCSECQTTFRCIQKFRVHLRTHTSFSCNFCSKTFKLFHLLVQHKYLVHNFRSSSSFLCVECNKIFHLKSALQRHNAKCHVSACKVPSILYLETEGT